MDCSLPSPPGSSVHGIFPGKNTGVGCHALLQVSFPTQGLNLALPHCRQTLYHLSYQGSQTLKTKTNPKKGLILLPKMHTEQEGEVRGVRRSKGCGWGGIRGQMQTIGQRSESFWRGTKELRPRNCDQVHDCLGKGVWCCAKGPPLEDEMAPHSSILAWEIPWTEEPGGLPGGHRDTN